MHISSRNEIGSIRWITGVRLFHNGDIQIARKFEEIFKFRLDLLASSDRTLKEVRGQDGDPLRLVDILMLTVWMDKVNQFLVGLVKVVNPNRWKQPVSDTERP
jgi:hypothetical protein